MRGEDMRFEIVGHDLCHSAWDAADARQRHEGTADIRRPHRLRASRPSGFTIEGQPRKIERKAV